MTHNVHSIVTLLHNVMQCDYLMQNVKCAYMYEYMEEGRHSVTDNGVMVMWNSTVHTELESL